MGFDVGASVGHHDIRVHLGARILHVGQVEQRHPIHDAHAHGGQRRADGIGTQHLALHQCRAGAAQSQPRSGDRGGARAAIRLQHIAVDQHGALAQRAQIHHRPQRTADQALDLVGASADLARYGLSRGTRGARARQHGVLGGEPTLAAALQEWRHALLDAGDTQHTRVAHLNHHRAFGVAQIVYCQAHGPQLVRGAPVRTRWHLILLVPAGAETCPVPCAR